MRAAARAAAIRKGKRLLSPHELAQKEMQHYLSMPKPYACACTLNLWERVGCLELLLVAEAAVRSLLAVTAVRDGCIYLTCEWVIRNSLPRGQAGQRQAVARAERGR